MSPIDKKDAEFQKEMEVARADGMALAFRYVLELLNGQGPSEIYGPLDGVYQAIKRRIAKLQGK